MLHGKSTVLKTNDENIVPKVHNVKSVTDTYKAFVSVTSTNVDTTEEITDENRPPHNDEVDHAIANCSFTGIRFVFFFSISTLSMPLDNYNLIKWVLHIFISK